METGILYIICTHFWKFIMMKYIFLIKKEKSYNSGRNKPTIKTSHLLFMDGLKLYANNDINLETLLEVVWEFSEDVRMRFGLVKCKNRLSRRVKYCRQTTSIWRTTKKSRRLTIQKSTNILECSKATASKQLRWSEQSAISTSRD